MFSVRIKSLISLALASCWSCTQALARLIPVLSGPTNLGAQVLPASCSCSPIFFCRWGINTHGNQFFVGAAEREGRTPKRVFPCLSAM